MFDREEAFVLAVQAEVIQQWIAYKNLLPTAVIVEAVEAAADRELPDNIHHAAAAFISTNGNIASQWPLRAAVAPPVAEPEPEATTNNAYVCFTAEQANQYAKDRNDIYRADGPTFDELVSRLDDSIRIRARRGKQQLQVFKTLRKDHDIYEAEVSDELVARLELHYEAAEYNWWPGEFDTTLSWAD